MLKTLKTALVAATATLTATAALAQVNLTSNTAGAGTTAGLTATALVEYAANRGIANIQLKDGQTGTNYIQALAEGKIDIANGPFILPFLLTRAAGPYAMPFASEMVEGDNDPIGPDGAGPVSAKYFNNRKLSIFGGSNEIQKNIISKMILGL